MSSVPLRLHGIEAARRGGQHGIALITCLLLLVMLTLLAISMFRGYGLQQKLAGNTREKQRAFEAAESALQYGEYWLPVGVPGTGAPCTTSVAISTDADVRACSNELANPGDPDNWVGAMTYTPDAMKVASGGGVATDGNGNADINYAKIPGLYIAYLGLSPDSTQMLYRVTGAGYGGSSGTTAVVQSVYAVSSSVKSLDDPTFLLR
jgi:type IV pilus assembly protein PilX